MKKPKFFNIPESLVGVLGEYGIENAVLEHLSQLSNASQK